jgi:hypothetical protein
MRAESLKGHLDGMLLAALEPYLAQIAAGLPGPGRAQAGILAELRAGLLDAIDAHRAAGLPDGRAISMALAEFGDPDQVAAAFRPELAARSARRTALALAATGPLIGLLWAVAALTSHIDLHPTALWPWAGAPPGSLLDVPLAVVAVTAVAALFTVAATGHLTRWLPHRPGLAPATAAVAGFGAVTADVILLALLAAELASAPGALTPAPAAAAAAASLTRLILARRAARRCLTHRATLA